MARYIRRNGRFVSAETGEPMHIPERDGLCTPMIIPDIEPYQSPVDGAYVSGRAAKRDDLKKHNCVDAADLPRSKKRAPLGKFRNKRFAEKHGLPLEER